MTWTPPKPELCGPDCTCRTDAEATDTDTAQAIGDHDRRQREIDTELDQLRPCTCATSDTPGQHHCGPSAQLPPRREDTERARDWPAYQTGRAPAQKNPAAERAPGGVSDQPSATACTFTFDGPEPQEPLHVQHLGDTYIQFEPRAPWWRRILNARKSSR